MAIDNALLGFPHSGQESKYSTVQLWDRQDAKETMLWNMAYRPKTVAHYAAKLCSHPMGREDRTQTILAIAYLDSVQSLAGVEVDYPW